MKKPVWVVGLVGMSLLLSGCGDFKTNPAPKPTSSATVDPSVSGAVHNPVDECLSTINVIGMSDPGTSGEANSHVQNVYSSIRHALVGEVNGIEKNDFYTKVKFTVPTYEGDTAPIVSPVDDIDAESNGYYDKTLLAGRAIVNEMIAADKECPGVSNVLVGHGFGAAAIHRAVRQLGMNGSEKEGKNLADTFQGALLMSDPLRSPSDEIAKVDGGTFIPGDSVGDARVAPGMDNIGSRGQEGIYYDDRIEHKFISVCNSHDLQCNFPTDMRSDKKREGVIASHGGIGAVHQAINDYDSDSPHMEKAISWLTDNIKGALAADQKMAEGTKQDKSLDDYLEYVNADHEGAKVVQDVFDAPAIVNTCEADYMIVGVRGSGEETEGNTQSDSGKKDDTGTVINGTVINGGRPAQEGAPLIQGFTEFPATVAWEIKKSLPNNSTVRFVPVEYDALPIEGTLLIKRDKDKPVTIKVNGMTYQSNEIEGLAPAAYFESMEKGVKMLLNTILHIEDTCENTKIIVVGYSQGAQVAHTGLSQLSENQSRQVASSVLIADPIRNRADGAVVVFDAETQELLEAGTSGDAFRWGVTGGVASLSHGKPLPNSLENRVIDICDPADLVCHVAKGSGITAHTTSYSKEQYYGMPSKRAASTAVAHNINR